MPEFSGVLPLGFLPCSLPPSPLHLSRDFYSMAVAERSGGGGLRRQRGVQDGEKQAGTDFLLMAYCKGVERGVRTKHLDRCCVPLGKQGLSIYVSRGGGVQIHPMTGRPTPTPSGPGRHTGEEVKSVQAGRQLGRSVSLSSHPPSPITQQAPSTDPPPPGVPNTHAQL